jgi:hypothetical protein
MKSFKVWLISGYLGSDCPFGDLAHDVSKDKKMYGKYTAGAIKRRIRQHQNDIDGSVMQTLNEAVLAYSEYKKSEVE